MAPVTIALDAMGGDNAPGPEVAGAVAAARARGTKVVLLGDEARIRQELHRIGGTEHDVSVRHCSQVITMDDHPGQAVRKKRDASMRVAFEMVKRGEAQAVVSAGNSGAMLACGLFILGRIKGLDRPGIAVTLPTLEPTGIASAPRVGQCVVLDTGANIDCKPITLAQFAVLGATYARIRELTPRARPRVGLLANGEEASKGTALLRDAHHILSHADSYQFDYAGFVEGRDIFQGIKRAAPSQGPLRTHALSTEPATVQGLDVVVTDGFTGNVLLKTAEGAGRFIADLLKAEVMRSWLVKLGALLMRPALLQLKRIVDVEARGGAPLLGVNGVAIICHGRSGPRAITRAIEVAEEQVAAGLLPAMTQAVASHRTVFEQLAASRAAVPSANDEPGERPVALPGSDGTLPK
ncbi:MAG: phosphate acyltransferase [Myxococcales bacterium]|nr:phosphate acyltransferase [Myxococcales bacterium]